MRTKYLALFTAVVSLIALSGIRAQDPLPPTPPGGSSAPAQTPGSTPSTPTPNQPLGGKGRRGAEAGNRLEKLKDELGLTPDQINRMKPIFEKAHEQMKALRNSSLAADEKRRKVREIFMRTIQEIKPILTPAQLAKLKELHKEHSQTATAATTT